MNVRGLHAEALRINSEPRALEALMMGLSPESRGKILRLIHLFVLVGHDELTLRASQPIKDLDALIAFLESRIEKLQRRG